MSGLLSYRQENQQTSALCGYGIRQAGVQGYLTNQNVIDAVTAEDLVTSVQNAIVAPGAEADSQRDSIVRCIREGAQLGDFSDARLATVATVAALANLTWVSDDADTSHLGINLVP